MQHVTVCSLEKVNPQVKLLYLLNHMCYFNNMQNMWN